MAASGRDFSSQVNHPKAYKPLMLVPQKLACYTVSFFNGYEIEAVSNKVRFLDLLANIID